MRKEKSIQKQNDDIVSNNKWIKNEDCFIYKEATKYRKDICRYVDKNFILIVLEGCCEITFEEMQSKTMHKNQMASIQKGVYIRFKVLGEVKYILLILDHKIYLEGRDSYVPCLQNKNLPKINFLDIRSPLRNFFDLMVYYFQNNINDIDLQEMKEREFFYLFKELYNSKEKIDFFYYFTSSFNVIDYINNHYLECKSIEELINRSPYSKNVFIKQFKSVAKDTTIHEYIKEKKKELLSYMIRKPGITSMDLEIKLNLGKVTLYRYCMETFNQTPTQLIKTYKQKQI